VKDLNHHLVELLAGHGVTASIVADEVLVDPNGAAASLRARRVNPNSMLLSVNAVAPDGVWLTDLWAGLGEDDDAAVRDGLWAFCLNIFHVYLAATWGLLETDQVDHVELSSGDRTWDLYVGGLMNRSSSATELQAPPIWDGFLAAVSAVLLQRSASVVGRLYVNTLAQQMTFEALVNGKPDPVMANFWESLPWHANGAGFASQRMMWIAVPRSGVQPAHARVGRCSES
jgi:hypothetical protein